MSDTIDDTAAIVFARQFYAAVAAAQSIGAALQQARLAMTLAATGDEDLPESRARDDVDIDTLILVTPPGATAATPPAVLPAHSGVTDAGLQVLRLVEQIEGQSILTDEEVVRASGLPIERVRVELRRLLDDGFVAGTVLQDLSGGLDVATPRLTSRAVAVLAHSS